MFLQLPKDLKFYIWKNFLDKYDKHIFKYTLGIYTEVDNDSDFINHLCYNGYLNLLKWAYNNEYDLNTGWTYADAALNGHFEVMEWLYSEGIYLHERTYRYAAEGGHIEILKWLKARMHMTWTSEVCSYAAYGGQLETLKWLIENHCPCNVVECRIRAATNGHIRVLEWISANTLEAWDDGLLCVVAAETNQLETLQWLRRRGAPLSEDACLYATHKGHAKIVAWLHGEGNSPCSCARNQ